MVSAINIQTNATIWCMTMACANASVWANARYYQVGWSPSESKIQMQFEMKHLKCPYYVFTYTACISWFFMHVTGINGFLAFFWWFFIYNLFHSKLRLNSYDFLKFRQYSGISWVKIISEINYCVSSTSAWRKRVNGADQVKPDRWVPLVSDPVN